MKPDWKDAPEWAQWLAMDGDGCWFWFEAKPLLAYPGCDDCYWKAARATKFRMAHGAPKPSADTLEPRP